MCHYTLTISTIYSLTEMSKRRPYVADSGFSKIRNKLKKKVHSTDSVHSETLSSVLFSCN